MRAYSEEGASGEHASVGNPAGIEAKTLLEQLSLLRSAWSTTPEAAGGVAAMAGFNFQFAKAVLATISQEISGGEGVTFVEALSDIVEADQGVVITQAKRILSSGSLHSGLGEF